MTKKKDVSSKKVDKKDIPLEEVKKEEVDPKDIVPDLTILTYRDLEILNYIAGKWVGSDSAISREVVAFDPVFRRLFNELLYQESLTKPEEPKVPKKPKDPKKPK